MPSASTTNAQETANTPNVATQETEEARTAREASEARAERARHRSLHRTPKGKAAWDKDRTRELFRQYKATGDSEVRDQLIVSHLNLVRFLASKFKNRGEPLDDLIQVGTIGLIKAIDRFDPSRGLEFTTYATPTILGEIKRHFRDKGWSVRVPPPAGALGEGQPGERRAHQRALAQPLRRGNRQARGRERRRRP